MNFTTTTTTTTTTTDDDDDDNNNNNNNNNKEKACPLITIATPVDSDVNTKETEELSKYKDLEIDVNRMWKFSAKILQVIIGALGTFKNLQLLPGHRSAIELQKVTLMSSAHSIVKSWGKSL